jgi:nucleoside phosphorylase
MRESADFVIVTALEEERAAVLAKLPRCRRIPPSDDDIRVYYEAEVCPTAGHAAPYRVIVMSLLGMGRVEAATAASDAIRTWRPHHVLLVGIAGGVAERRVGLGDVLVSEQIVDYELQKELPDGPEVRWHVHRGAPRLLGEAKDLPAHAWQSRISSHRPIEGSPKQHVGPIASGDKVAAVTGFLAKYRMHWPSLIGIEMEAAGVASACFQASPPPGFFMMRGVSDLADEHKDSLRVAEWREYACEVAAAYAVALLEAGPVPKRQIDVKSFDIVAPARPKLHASAQSGRVEFSETAVVQHSASVVPARLDLETQYSPYPVELVEALERLTRQRGQASPDETPADREARQKRIDDIVAKLKGHGSPTRDDVVVGTRLVRIVGKGSYGVVWQGVHELTGAMHAVKIFDSDRLGLGLTLHHFRRGVLAMEHLNRVPDRPPSVITLIEREATDLAFSMAYLDGQDLTHVERRGWGLEKKLSVFRAICSAVDFAHQNNVLHRDIKPANIVMTADGQPVLTDFDIADLLLVQTMSVQATGTTFYAAPEQLAGRGSRERSGDLYSLGRLLHYLLLERDPELRFERVPTLESLSAQPRGLVRIIRKCTMEEPVRRYQTIAALLADLARYEMAPDSVGEAPAARQASSWRLAVVLAVTALVALGVGLGWPDETPSAIVDSRGTNGKFETLQEQVARRRKELLEVPPDLIDTERRDFSKLGDGGIIRLLDVDGDESLLGNLYGGRVYSFPARTHDAAGKGQSIMLSNGNLQTGGWGADYGYILPLGQASLKQVVALDTALPKWLPSSKHAAWRYLWDYRPPSAMKDIRAEQREASSKKVGSTAIHEIAPVIQGEGYLLRAINIDRADSLVALRVEKRLPDQSVVIAWRILKKFDPPVATGPEPTE